MPLAPGTRLGPHEILAPLGAGGMGEVYKARDTRLDRMAIPLQRSEQRAGVASDHARPGLGGPSRAVSGIRALRGALGVSVKDARRAAGALAFFLFLVGAVAGAEPLQFTVIGIDCKECAPPIVKALREVPGVKTASLDWKKGVATVDVAPGFDRTKIKKAIDAIGYDAVFPGESRKEFAALPADVVGKLDIVSFDGAKKIDLKTIAVPGKITVVDYWAEWCSPCHFLEKRLQHLLNSDPKMALRRVNVGKWDNAAARQATAEFRLEALPYVRVYDARGKFVADVTGGSWDQFLKVLEKARARG